MNPLCDLTIQIRPTVNSVTVTFSERLHNWESDGQKKCLPWDWSDDPMFIPLTVSHKLPSFRPCSESDSLSGDLIDDHTVRYLFHNAWSRQVQRLIVLELKRNIEESLSYRYNIRFK